MDNKTFEKSSNIFKCINCDYVTNRKSQYDRHLLTSKHRRITMDNKMDNENVPKNKQYECVCGKCYNYMSGLSKHKTKCEFKKKSEVITNFMDTPEITPEVIYDVLQQNLYGILSLLLRP